MINVQLLIVDVSVTQIMDTVTEKRLNKLNVSVFVINVMLLAVNVLVTQQVI